MISPGVSLKYVPLPSDRQKISTLRHRIKNILSLK